MSEKKIIAILWIFSLLTVATPAQAQFYGNTIPAEFRESQSGAAWFGSVRTEAGDFVADATVLLDTGTIEYVAVTGNDGRFRLLLPEATRTDDVSPSCAHTDYNEASLRLRPAIAGPTASVELNCVLR